MASESWFASMYAPVDTDEIAFGMTLFVNAARGKTPVPGSFASVAYAQQCEEQFLALSFGTKIAPDPIRRAALLKSSVAAAFSALWHHYNLDERRLSVCARVLGFCFLMERTRGEILQLWQAPVSGAELVALHPAVIQSLATVALEENGMLRESAFIEHLSQVAEAYPDLKPKLPLRLHFVEPNPEVTWPEGDGELAALMRIKDWSTTICGTVDTWPQSKKTAIEIVLACKFPMIVLWGPELVQFYNDSYRDLMGTKHPTGLGQPTQECWPEVWSINEPIYARVRTGETLTFEDLLFPIVRYGYLEDAYFTLCYSPLRLDSAEISGIVVTIFETTLRVRARLQGSSEKHPHGTNGDLLAQGPPLKAAAIS